MFFIKHLITVVSKLLQTLDDHLFKQVHMHVNVAEIMFDASRRFSGSYTAKNDNLEKSLAGILTDQTCICQEVSFNSCYFMFPRPMWHNGNVILKYRLGFLQGVPFFAVELWRYL